MSSKPSEEERRSRVCDTFDYSDMFDAWVFLLLFATAIMYVVDMSMRLFENEEHPAPRTKIACVATMLNLNAFVLWLLKTMVFIRWSRIHVHHEDLEEYYRKRRVLFSNGKSRITN